MDDNVMRAVIDNKRAKRRKGFKDGGQNPHDLSKSRRAVAEFVSWMTAQKSLKGETI